MNITDRQYYAQELAGSVFPPVIPENILAPMQVRDMIIDLPGDFSLASSQPLEEAFVRVRLHGNMSNPVIAVLGGISAGRIVADHQNERGWWRQMAGPKRAIDTGRFCVLSFDFLPNEEKHVIKICPSDQARALAHILQVLHISSLHSLIGASYGGAVALQFAALFPERLQRLVVLAAAHKQHPMATAVRGIQRRIIEFGLLNGDGKGAVALARQLAMTTYRSADEFEARFAGPLTGKGNSEACDYLVAKAQSFEMAPERYLALSLSLDLHQINPKAITAKSLIIAIDGDRLVPVEHMRELAAKIPGSRIIEIPSIYGHDGFLKETAAISPPIRSFINGVIS